MLHASGLLAADTVGFEQHLKMSPPVGFEVANSVMDLQQMVDIAEFATISAEVPGKLAFMPCKSKDPYLFFIL